MDQMETMMFEETESLIKDKPVEAVWSVDPQARRIVAVPRIIALA
jgi:hypothetical protein